MTHSLAWAIGQAQLTQDQLVLWCAGFFDGEVYMRVRKNSPEITVDSITPADLFRCAKTFGGKVRPRQNLDTRHRQVWRWTIYGKGAIACAVAVLPYLSNKRPQAECVALCQTFPYTTETGRLLRERAVTHRKAEYHAE